MKNRMFFGRLEYVGMRAKKKGGGGGEKKSCCNIGMKIKRQHICIISVKAWWHMTCVKFDGISFNSDE